MRPAWGKVNSSKVVARRQLSSPGSSSLVLPNTAVEYADNSLSGPAVRPGVEAMQKVLDAVPSLGLVSGRVDNNP
jgi:hypothetical protein